MNQIKTPFFTLPQLVVRAGILREMKPCELSLAVALHHEMERLSNPVLVLTNEAIFEMTGLSPSAIRLARTKLAERNLVSLRRVAGGMYEYTILNPETGIPWVRVRGKRGRGPGGSGSPESTAEAYKPILSSPQMTQNDSPGLEMKW